MTQKEVNVATIVVNIHVSANQKYKIATKKSLMQRHWTL